MTKPKSVQLSSLKDPAKESELTAGIMNLIRAEILPRLHELERAVHHSEPPVDHAPAICELTKRVAQLQKSIDHKAMTPLIAGKLDTVGGSTVQYIQTPMIAKGMKSFAIVCKQGAVPVTIVSSHCENGQLKITFSADPSNDHSFSYLVFN